MNRFVEIDTFNGITELTEIDLDAYNRDNTHLSNDAITIYLDNFKEDHIQQWIITEEQYEYIDAHYGINPAVHITE